MGAKTKANAVKPKAFSWMDANASVLTVNQMKDHLENEFGLTKASARVYISQWRKANGVQRSYSQRKKEENNGGN